MTSEALTIRPRPPHESRDAVDLRDQLREQLTDAIICVEKRCRQLSDAIDRHQSARAEYAARHAVTGWLLGYAAHDALLQGAPSPMLSAARHSLEELRKTLLHAFMRACAMSTDEVHTQQIVKLGAKLSSAARGDS